MALLYEELYLLVTYFEAIFVYCSRQLPASKKIVEQINAGYWDRSDEESYRLEMIRRNLTPDTKDLLRRKTELMSKKEDPPKMIEI